MNLLRIVSWPYVRQHVLRTALTATGIVLGVAVFVGLHAANRSVLAAFSQTIDRIAGRTELQVTAGETSFSEEVLETVQRAASVGVAVPVIELAVESGLKGEGSLLILAIDMTGDRSLREYELEEGDAAVIEDPLVFLAQPDSIMISKELADRQRLAIGGRLMLDTVEGRKAFTIRGIMRPSGLGSAFGGSLAIMDIYAAQAMFGRGRMFDRIDLAVKKGSTIDDCRRELQHVLGPAFEIRPPSSRSQQFESMLSGYAVMWTLSSAFALFVGLFLIHNAFAIAVSQRRREIGILRALGATRGQIRRLFLGESLVLGVAGSLLGIAIGVGAARALAASLTSLVAGMYGVAAQAAGTASDPKVMALAFGAGVLTSVLAALFPAREAARIEPVQAIEKSSAESPASESRRARLLSAGVVALGAAGCLLLPDSRLFFYLGYALVVVLALVLAPLLTLVVARGLHFLLTWWRPVEGALAVGGLVQASRRTGATVSALMLSLALVIAFGGMARASYGSIVDWLDTTLNPDLFVMPSPNPDLQATRFPAEMAAELSQLPGVGRVQVFRNTRVPFQGGTVMVVAMEMASVGETSPQRPIAGDLETMYRTAAAGRGLIVSDNFAQTRKVALGDTVSLAAPHGSIVLPVVGVVMDYSDQQGAIFMDRRLYVEQWQDHSVSDFRVYVTPGADATAVRQRIQERYAGKRQVFVLSNGELRSYILNIVEQWFGLTDVQIAVAVLVAVLGIVNALTVSILDRRRELATLRATGALRSQIRHMIRLEAISVGAVGLVLGIAFGALNLHYILQIVHRDVAGLRLDYQFPVGTALVLVPIILAASWLAALWPAESAVRGSLVEALEYE